MSTIINHFVLHNVTLNNCHQLLMQSNMSVMRINTKRYSNADFFEPQQPSTRSISQHMMVEVTVVTE